MISETILRKALMESPWIIEYWPDAIDEIRGLLNNRNRMLVKSLSKEIGLLKTFGNELKLPHSKTLGGKLFELRERMFGYRVYYTFKNNKVILLLGAGDKTTQEKDIKIARKRLDILLRQGANQ